MPQIMMTIGALLLIVGLFGLVKSVKGRLLPTPPYCSKCKYDLSDLDLDQIENCPECGRRVIEGTRSVRHFRWRIRIVLLLCSLILTSGGVIGLAWPKVMVLRMFDRVEWYQHWPDSALLLFERVGDDAARWFLFQRSMQGELSESGVRRLTVHANEMLYSSEEHYLKKRWEEVLHLAMLEHRLDQDDLEKFIEYSIIPRVEIREEISAQDDRVFADFKFDELVLFTQPGTPHISILKKNNSIPTNGRIVSPHSIRVSISQEVVSGDGSEREEVGSVPAEAWPHTSRSKRLQTSVHFPLDEESLSVVFRYDFEIFENQQIVHAWTLSDTKTIRRAASEDFAYATPISDTTEINTNISRLSLYPIIIPTQIEQARAYQASSGYIVSPIRMLSQRLFEHSLMGDIRIRVGDVEIPYEPIVWKPVKHTSSRMDLISHIDSAGWLWSSSSDFVQVLDYFEKYAEFWELALEVGKVDVLIVPNPEIAKVNPKVSSFVDRTIIFRDARIMAHVPSYVSGTNTMGEPYERLRWLPAGFDPNKPSPPRHVPLMAQILTE